MSQQKSENPPLRVVIADDIIATLLSTRLMFTLIPDTEVVEIAHTGREVIEVVKEHKPDMVLLDINMPELDGLSATKAILKNHPQLACIIMSSEGDPHTVQSAKAAGARDFLMKPFTSEQLLNAVQPIISMLRADQQRYQQTNWLKSRRQAHLEQMGENYIKARRADGEAMALFEELAASPNCELRWLKTLAMIYVVQTQWAKLKRLAERLERRDKMI